MIFRGESRAWLSTWIAYRLWTMTDGWYEVVQASVPITQGDLIFKCPLSTWADESALSDPGVQSTEASGIDADLTEILRGRREIIAEDVIVMTQACDLAHGKVTDVVLCAHYALSTFKNDVWKPDQEKKNQKVTSQTWEKWYKTIVNGSIWNFCMLNSSMVAEHPMEHRVVDFHRVYTVPRDFLGTLLRKRSEPRLRLLPPYREHVSQAFARFFMRVGLPQDLNAPQC